jgi:hypothetical protein
MKAKKSWRNNLALGVAALSLGLVLACGGGGGTVPGTSGGALVSGAAVKGPVAGASVTAYAVRADGTRGERIGGGQTDSMGNFSFVLSDYSGAVLIEMAGGHYLDEATLADMPLSGTMTAAVPFVSQGSAVEGIQVTPLTSMAQARAADMPGGMSQANIRAANAAVGNFFDVDDILHSRPMDTTVEGSGAAAGQYARNYGMVLASMSMLANSVGLDGAAMVPYFVSDASDGYMDGMTWGSGIRMGGAGMMGGGMMLSPDAATSGLALAMHDFIYSQMNRSGVTFQEMADLYYRLSASDGAMK